MRLAEFIVENMEAILLEWERFARSLTSGADMDVTALRDHAEAILRSTARDMGSAQTPQQQSDKSKGLGGGGTESDRLDSASKDHAIGRLGSGFDLVEVVSEYRALRASVLHLWRQSTRQADERDLDDLTRFNESIDQSLAEAVRSYSAHVDESRELFLAMLGHDLRAPLNAVMLSAQTFTLTGKLETEQAEIAGRIPHFVRTMTAMIHDLLDFTRTRLGNGIPLSIAPLDLGALCAEVLDEFRAANPDRLFRLRCEGDVHGEWDGARLRQVVSNLVANAVEHGEERGEIALTANGNDSGVVLAVRNDGPPIPSSALPTLFKPFVRGATNPSVSQRRDGVGLGLFISREIVTAHGGTISVETSEHSGTTFKISLPRKPPEPPRA